ncbi:prephenate dehydratase domain-containing protein [Chloroflexota bacterium]
MKRIQGVSVAFQGEIGAYSEEAAYRFFGSSVQTRPYESLEEVFKVVPLGQIPFGISIRI